MRAAALQYVRKISGFREPAAHNAAAMPPIRVRGPFASPSFVPDPAAMV